MSALVKITALDDIGINIAKDTVVPVVNLLGVPTTQKANVQIMGNLILSGAGGANFVMAAKASYATTATTANVVANADQPNITSVGTLVDLTTTGNITLAANLTLEGTSNPNVASDMNIAFKIPILINGNTYYIALTEAE